MLLPFPPVSWVVIENLQKTLSFPLQYLLSILNKVKQFFNAALHTYSDLIYKMS